MNKKNSKCALLTSVVSLAVCGSMLAGTTFAWFTDSVSSTNNVITAGNLDVELYYKTDLKDVDEEWKSIEDGIFSDETLWEPGHTEVVYLKVANEGSLALQYKMTLNILNEKKGLNKDGGDIWLSDYLKVGVVGESELGSFTNREAFAERAIYVMEETVDITGVLEDLGYGNGWGQLIGAVSTEKSLEKGEENVTALVITMPETVGNEANYNGVGVPEINFGINVVAKQATYESDSFDNYYDEEATYPTITKPKNTWNGTADTSWYNNTDTSFDLTTAEQLAGLAALVDNGTDTFAGKTINLTNDMDLYVEDENGEPITFDPIGDKIAFEGTFDGQGHEISNMYQSGWALGYEWGSYGSVGLFGELKSATVKNVTVSGAESFVEGGDVGGITGSATGNCVFENITIKDSTFATYNNGNGGIIGWSGAGTYTFKNITLAEDVTLAGLWGSFDSSIGGIVGQGEPGATYNFENVDIACRLDVYNDCTASYDYYNYRMCGMIIGRLAETTTIDGKNYPDTSKYNITCNDVTVTYGDWANYHYCDPTPGYNGGRGMRVEAGYSYDGLPADYDHSQCTNHCNALIAFDQIFGGAQYGVTGLPAYEGVTVVYNNK